MTLIKCKECGKEISNMAQSCPNCGLLRKFQNDNEISTTDNFEIKEWAELTSEEQNKVIEYRKKTNDWWNNNRILLSFSSTFGFVTGSIAVILQFGQIHITILGIIFILIALVSCYFSIEEEKEWYKNNKEKLYFKGILK